MNRDPEPALPNMRECYQLGELNEGSLASDPMAQFQTWFDHARTCGEVRESNAMTLATVSAEGMPSARTVLLKGLGAGFQFYTNFKSRKGKELAANGKAALVFLWKEIERQVCVRGKVSRLSHDVVEAYFQSRPYGSQIGAWTSKQSLAIPDRPWLEERETALRARYPEGKVPLPEFWGGFELIPEALEFWQGRPGRLHDRFGYQQGKGGGWVCQRLCP
mgnify:CR=1 FL=1|jgi:pyridoxamine 5'-phosphate oxidase